MKYKITLTLEVDMTDREEELAMAGFSGFILAVMDHHLPNRFIKDWYFKACKAEKINTRRKL